MKRTPIALEILERELTRQIIKLAAEGFLRVPPTDVYSKPPTATKPVPKPTQPPTPTTAEPVTQPIKPIAQLGTNNAGQTGRSMFDRQGNGDAQARAAIYNKTKQVGSQIYGALSSAVTPAQATPPAQAAPQPIDPTTLANKARRWPHLANQFNAEAASANAAAKAQRWPQGPMFDFSQAPPGPTLANPANLPAATNSAEALANKARRWPHLAGQFNAEAAAANAAAKAKKWPAQSPAAAATSGIVDAASGLSDFASGAGTAAYHVPGVAAGIFAEAGGRLSDAVGLSENAGRAGADLLTSQQRAMEAGVADATNGLRRTIGFPSAPTAAPGAPAPQPAPQAAAQPGVGQPAPIAGAQQPATAPVSTPAASPAAPAPTAAAAMPPPAAVLPGETKPMTPELKRFFADNNISTSADLGNLTEEQKLQFNDLYEQYQQSEPAPAASTPAPDAASTQAQQPPAGPAAQQQTAQPAAGAEWGSNLPETATPEQREQANQAQQQLSSMPAPQQQQLGTALNDPKSPAAQQLEQRAVTDFAEHAKSDPNNPMPTEPQQQGAWWQQTLNTFNELPFPAKMAIGAGLSVGVVSMLSSLMGGGGMGSLLLGALGLGAAGLVGASNGMLGDDAKGWVNDAFSGLVTAFGGNVPNEADIRARLEAAAKQGPEQAKAELEKVRAEVQPYAAVSRDAGKFLTESANKDYMYNKVMQHGRDNYADLASKSTWYGLPTGAAASAVFGKPEMKDTDPNQRNWNEWFWGAPGSPQREQNIQRNLPAGWQKPAADVSMLQRILVKSALRKAARCWAGYEPVPGTKAYSEGSCRPKGSKKTRKEVIQGKKHVEKKAGGPGTGSFTIGQQTRPLNVQYREQPLTGDEAARLKAVFAQRGGNSAYAQNMAAATTPERIRQIVEGYGRSNFGKNDAFAQQIAGIIGDRVPATVATGASLPTPPQPAGVGNNSAAPQPNPQAQVRPAPQTPAPAPVPAAAPATAPAPTGTKRLPMRQMTTAAPVPATGSTADAEYAKWRQQPSPAGLASKPRR